MKKFMIITFIILSLLIGGAIAKQTDHKPSKIHQIEVNLINQFPDPAEPGKYTDVRFKLDNNGSGTLEDVEVQLIPDYPFSLDDSDDAIKNIGTIQGMQRGDVGVIVKYRIRVDENAVEGDNDLRIRYRPKGEAWIEPPEFKIKVQTHDAILSVDEVKTSIGNQFKPGKGNNMSIRLSNKADSVLKDIKIKLELDDAPFIPVGSSNEKSIAQLQSKGVYDVIFNIMAVPEAESGAYKVPLIVSYSDELGKNYSARNIVGMIVGSSPDISLSLDSTEIYQSGNSGEIVLKIVNKGVTDIKFVNLKLLESNGIRLISNDAAYLGNIDSDDFETADFMIFAEKTREKKLDIPFILEYKDANNNEFIENHVIQINMYSSSEAKKFGLKKENGYIGIFIIILIIIIGLFYYKQHKKKKKSP
jgi:hypothetical protein